MDDVPRGGKLCTTKARLIYPLKTNHTGRARLSKVYPRKKVEYPHSLNRDRGVTGIETIISTYFVSSQCYVFYYRRTCMLHFVALAGRLLNVKIFIFVRIGNDDGIKLDAACA